MRIQALVTTNAAGAATVYASKDVASDTPLPPIAGRWVVESITYIKNDFASGVDFTITEAETGMPIWTGTNVDASTTFYPRAFVGDPITGTVSSAVYDWVVLEDGHIKIGIASGGDTKSGRFVFRLSQ